MSLKMGSWSCKPDSKLFIDLLSFPSFTLFYRYRIPSVLRAPFRSDVDHSKTGGRHRLAGGFGKPQIQLPKI